MNLPIRSKSHRRRILGAGVWTPTSPTTDGAASPAHWYRSDDAYQEAARSTPCTADADPVGSWTDKAASADHVSQSTADNKPTWQNAAGDQLNGHPVIEADGTNDYLQGAFTTGGSLSQPNTLFIVAQLDASRVNTGTNDRLIDGNVVNTAALFQRGASAPDAWAFYAGALQIGGDTDSDWNVWCALFNGASSQLWANGVSEVGPGNAGAAAMGGLTVFDAVGAPLSPWKGKATEILIYDAALSNADKNEIGNYLATRYGLTWTTI